MDKKFMKFIGIAVLALMLGLNSKHALDNYGMKSEKMYLTVLAQTTSSSSVAQTFGYVGEEEASYRVKRCENKEHKTTITKGDITKCNGTGSKECKPEPRDVFRYKSYTTENNGACTAWLFKCTWVDSE